MVGPTAYLMLHRKQHNLSVSKNTTEYLLQACNSPVQYILTEEKNAIKIKDSSLEHKFLKKISQSQSISIYSQHIKIVFYSLKAYTSGLYIVNTVITDNP